MNKSLRNRLIIKTSLLLCICLFCQKTYAQKFEYDIKLQALIDNIENNIPHEEENTIEGISTETYLGIKLAPEIGISLDDKHYIFAGADLTHALGEDDFPSDLDYLLYYKYKHKHKLFNFYFGSFARNNSNREYSRNLFKDNHSFYDYTIEGVMFQYMSKNKKTKAEVFFDYYNKDKALRIDEFMVVGSFSQDLLIKQRLIVGAEALMNHFKNKHYLKDSYLLNRIQYNIKLEANFADLVHKNFDRISLKATYQNSNEKTRSPALDKKINAKGFELEAHIRYKGIGLVYNKYMGDAQLSYLDQYGIKPYQASVYYAFKDFDRINLSYYWSNKYIYVKADLIYYKTSKFKVNEQMLSFGVKIGS